jgi:type VI secretion system secreted protein VgrG
VFDCSFTAIPSSQTYRPPRVTPKPTIRGMQPALVVGPSGEEIHTDKHGRVKVSFFWDRVSTADEKSSCWLRVAQGWAGKKMGGFFLPRIGNEVLVSFLEGDPDRPIVTGSVYNAVNTPPYALPDEKTKSTVKTLSTKKGSGYNEFRFEDKKGDEEIYMRAEKDHNVLVNNDEKKYVGQDHHLHVKRDRFEEVEKNVSEKIGESYTGEVTKDFSLTIKGEASYEIVKKLTITAHDDVVETFGKKHHEETSDQYYLTAKEIVIEAGEHITIQVGESFIAIDKNGISLGTRGTFDIKATKALKVESEMDAISVKASAGNVGISGVAGVKVESKATTELKGSMMNVSGDAMTTIKGGMIKIN